MPVAARVGMFVLGSSGLVYGTVVLQQLSWTLVGAFLALTGATGRLPVDLVVGKEPVAEIRARHEQDALVQDISDVEGTPDFAALLDFNVRQMRVYQELSTSQARTSYRRSQFAFLIGLGLIAAAVVLAFLANDETTKIAASGVAGLGGALSAYISGTYLRVYERTLDQLNFYYRQPLVNSYLLTAERLANAMPDGKRDAAYERLLEQVLFSAQEPRASEHRKADRSSSARRRPGPRVNRRA